LSTWKIVLFDSHSTRAFYSAHSLASSLYSKRHTFDLAGRVKSAYIIGQVWLVT